MSKGKNRLGGLSAISPALPDILRWQSHVENIHHPVNSYIIRTSQGDVLIDPAEDFPSELYHPAAILVTHVQREHIAGAVRFPRSPLFVSAGDAYLCSGAKAYESLITPWQSPWDWSSRGNFHGHLAGARNERPSEWALAVDGTLAEGDDICGLKVVSTPGHGKNALSFILEVEGRTIIACGDLITGDGQLWNWFDCDWDYGFQSGQRALLASARRLLQFKPDILLPAHGNPVFNATNALNRLITNLKRVLRSEDEEWGSHPTNFTDDREPVEGWRMLSNHLYQWKDGNCALLISQTGAALMVDDGLCHWLPLEEREEHHRAVIAKAKEALGISRIEKVLVTHYHGDHIYNIPMLLKDESGVEVLTLDSIAPLLGHKQREFNVAAALWWYGAGHDVVPVHRTLQDGEILRWHEYDLKVFHLGGQTFYHCGISATIDDAKVTFAGDALFGWNENCPPILCYNDSEPESRGWLYAIERLLDETPQLLVCGHGSAIRDPMPLLEAKRANWKQRLRDFDLLDFRHNRRAFFDPFLDGLP